MRKYTKTVFIGLGLCAFLWACAPFPPGPGGPHAAPNEPARREAPARQEAAPAKAETTRVYVRNANGSKTPVDLTRIGPNQWRGPKGEAYYGLPDEQKLRPAYGLR